MLQSTLRTLYLDQDQIELSNHNATLNLAAKNGITQKIPLYGIRKLVVKGNNKLTARLLAKLGALGIGLVALSGQQHQPTIFLPNTADDIFLRVHQTIAFQLTAFTFNLSKTTVLNKIEQQKQLLTVHFVNHPSERLAIQKARAQIESIQAKVAQAKTTKQLLGFEGSASRIYFKCLTHLVADGYTFTHRNARPPQDPFNVLLSLSYSLLTAEIVLALHIKGFDPYLGYLHTIAVGRPSLACDLIEPLRPMVDLFCLQLCSTQEIRPSHFKHGENRCILERAGRLKFYEAWEKQAQQREQKIHAQIEWLAKELKRDDK